jgi:hypothetical protein
MFIVEEVSSKVEVASEDVSLQVVEYNEYSIQIGKLKSKRQ